MRIDRGEEHNTVESSRKEIRSDLSSIPVCRIVTGISQIMIVKQAAGYIGGRLAQWCVPRALNSRSAAPR